MKNNQSPFGQIGPDFPRVLLPLYLFASTYENEKIDIFSESVLALLPVWL